ERNNRGNRSGSLTMTVGLQIGSRLLGNGHPCYIVAELSANHNQSFDQAVKIIHAAKAAGADAVKLQTYTPDTITIAGDREYFRINGGTIWDGRTLHELYAEAYTPWEWQPKLKQVANDLGLDLFSTPFDPTAVDFLEEMNVPAHKVASFELVDIPLVKKIARTGKPLIISTGMATLEEIEEAVAAAREAGATQIALLKCTSAYPAAPDDMNLRTIPELASRFGVPAGLSDHTPGIAVLVAAVALGACISAKHITLSRALKGPYSEFSLEPQQSNAMVDEVRTAERALRREPETCDCNSGPCTLQMSSITIIATQPATALDAQKFRYEIEQISRQSAVFFAGTMFTSVAAYAFKIYLARALGAEALGIYALGMTAVGAIGLVAALGLPSAAARYVAVYTARADSERLRALLWRSLEILLITNLLGGVGMFLARHSIAQRIYHTPSLAKYMVLFALIMLSGAFTTFLGQVLA